MQVGHEVDRRFVAARHDAVHDRERRPAVERQPSCHQLVQDDPEREDVGRRRDLFRQNLLGKRVDYSGRTVIVVGPELRLRRVLGTRLMQRWLKRKIDRRYPPGPTSEQRARYRSVLIAEASNAAGVRVASRLETVEGYTLTSWTAVEIARRAADGHAQPGYQTPATAYGADFILSFGQTRRHDE